MNYSELIESIRSMDDYSVTRSVTKWLTDHDLEETETLIGDIRKLAIEVANIAYNDGLEQGKKAPKYGNYTTLEQHAKALDEALGDPSRWYVLDKNGEKLHLGDRINTKMDGTRDIVALGRLCVQYASELDGLILVNPKDIEKVVPDTREYLIGELLDCCIDREFAEDIIDRAMKLKGE